MHSYAKCSEGYAKYFKTLEMGLEELSKIANAAKSRGFDPQNTVEEEIRVSYDLADRVEYMVGPKGVGKRIRELSHLPRIRVAFKIAEEILYGGFGALEEEKAAEQAIRTGIAILNEGVTAAPLQGINRVAIKPNLDGTGRGGAGGKHLAIYFAGPMRSAGGTELAIVTALGDYVRKHLNIDAYKASDVEVSRFIEELRLYEQGVGRFQFHVTDDDLAYVLRHVPVEVTGVKSAQIEVSSFRDVPGIETNSVRGGALRVVNDGIAGRSRKVLKIVDDLNLKGWEWLREIVEKGEKETVEKPEETETEKLNGVNGGTGSYLSDIIAGRPVFSFPSNSKYASRLRLRYGRSRNTGLTAVGIHPATMAILNNFIAVGTQLRLETPEKGGIVSTVDSIEPPIVRVKGGSVLRVEDAEQAYKLRSSVEKILLLGDLLLSFAEFYENEKPLLPSSYVEEWWVWDLKEALADKCKNSVECAAQASGVDRQRITSFLSDPLTAKPTGWEAVKLSEAIGVPLHPKYCYYWRNITSEELLELKRSISTANLEKEQNLVKKITLNLTSRVKELLEKLLVPHEVAGGRIVIIDDAPTLARCLGIDNERPSPDPDQSVFQMLKNLSSFDVKCKYSFLVGARMGRPEKAKERKMKPPVHVLFPVGLSGGPQRNIVEAAGQSVNVELITRRCPSCNSPLTETICPKCNVRGQIYRVCPKCGRRIQEENCPHCNVKAQAYEKQSVDVKGALGRAAARLGLNPPDVVKGVKGMTSEMKLPEPLEKGILRARHKLTVFKDGTIRFDLTNAPLTHFKPLEGGVSLEKLKELGYTSDIDGKPLTDVNQVCELKVQDIIVPENCADHLLQVSHFIDEMLERLYGLPRFYDAKSRGDMVGQLIIGLSPHTSAGVLGRIAGFSKLSVCYSHPLWIAVKRRDCDGDEDAIMLALEALLDFSRDYLPAQIGGIMDAPLLLTPVVNPLEVDDQVWSLDLCNSYPLEFYNRTLEGSPPRYVSDLIDMVKHRLNTPAQYEGYRFTHETSNINLGSRENVYKKLGTMRAKLEAQMDVMDKIEGVDTKEVAKRILTVHLMRDIAGNLRVFASQSFRCKKCNQRFRRIPLTGRCSRCGGEIALTVYRGSVEKYLEVAAWLARKYGVEDYYKQRIDLISDEIDLVFAGEKEAERKKETALTSFM